MQPNALTIVQQTETLYTHLGQEYRRIRLEGASWAPQFSPLHSQQLLTQIFTHNYKNYLLSQPRDSKQEVK